MELTTNFKTYQEQVTSSLISVTKSAAQISSQDLGFHRSSSDKFSKSLDVQGTHLLRLTNKLLKAAAKDTSVKAPTLQNHEDVEDRWRQIVDVIDDLLEKADHSLDEFTGVIKTLSPARQDVPDSQSKKSRSAQGIDQWSLSSFPKPQLLFERKVDNYETGPWKPLLSTKPHANMPLEDSIGSGEGGFHHPYAHEIQHMIYPNSIYNMTEPVPFSPPEESEPVFVDTLEAVHEMLEELRSAPEIAIDLEHNDKNSYVGLVCLMQISTRDKDWIVDTLKPWRERLEILNEVFANPRIVKILHGSTSDIIWLQRDLGLYIVGLFDTYHASNALQFPAKSLKYLLQRFANFEAQKQYQLADWRVRPLPQELIDYARSDTHFLLYIFDHLRNMLLEASTPHDNLIDRVLDASRREALQVYERSGYDRESGLNPGGWMRLLLQRTAHLSQEQLGVFRAVHEWRDKTARELDEGEQNIMPNAYIWTIAETMPTFRGAFHQRGAGRIPRYVAENIPSVIEIVKQGIAQGKEGPTVFEVIEQYGDRAGPMFGRNKFIRKKADDSARGIGATLQMLNQSGELPTTPSVVEPSNFAHEEPIAVKAALSRLWGNMEPLNHPSVANLEIVMQALNNTLPLQSLSQQPFPAADIMPANQDAKLSSHLKEMSNGTTRVGEAKDEIFTIADRNLKRKASDALIDIDPESVRDKTDSVDPDADIIKLSSEVLHPEIAAKRQAKLARKAEKRAKKLADAQARAAEQAVMVPFDYANAESMLHAKSDALQGGADHPNKGAGKPLNPFARVLDTSTGAKRNKMGKEMSGKSHTFKS